MKVLLIHNYLRPPSGENVVFEAERELLTENGVQILTYERSNLEIRDYGLFEKFGLAFRFLWSHKVFREIKTLIRKNRPDLAHFHNIFPLISSSGYYACRSEGVPVVQTLHNYKLFCPAGYLFRKGKICRDCIEKGLWSSVRNACYRNSKAQTAWFAAMLFIQRKLGTWRNLVDRYIALTDFGKNLSGNAGLLLRKISVKPNFAPDLKARERQAEGFGVFLGRLGEEKGLENLLYALKKTPRLPFKLVGEGPWEKRLKLIKNRLNLSNVEFLGYRPREETISILGRASFLVLPSIWYEGFPLVILEAMSLGKPVITTSLGGLPEIVKDGFSGFVVPPGDKEALAEKMDLLIGNKTTRESLGRNARKEYEEKYTPEKNYEKLISIYNQVLAREKGQSNG